MTQQNFNIDNLRIASPCSVGWEAMTGDERQRFCSLCKLNVYNFSEMSGSEIRALVVKSEGRICGRLYKRADGTILTKDCPVGLRAYHKRVSRFAGATLAAILGLFSVSFGQKENEKSVDASKIKIVRATIQSSQSIIIGQIMDEAGAVVPGAHLALFKDKSEEVNATSNDEGEYSFPALAAGIYTLKIKSLGFKIYEIKNIEIKSGEKSKINITLKINGEFLVGVLGIEEPPLIDTTSSGITTTITTRALEKLPH